MTGRTLIGRAEERALLAGHLDADRSVMLAGARGGTGFQSGATVAFSGTGITVNSVTWNATSWNGNPTLSLDVSVSPTAATGSRDVTVTNLDGGVAVRTGAFKVT